MTDILELLQMWISITSNNDRNVITVLPAVLQLDDSIGIKIEYPINVALILYTCLIKILVICWITVNIVICSQYEKMYIFYL